VLWTYADATRDYLGRGKGSSSGSKAGSENGRIEMIIGIEVMEIFCWKERNRPERAKARSGSNKAGSRKLSKADRGNGWKDT
jgi:hypothetical protein